MITLILLTSCGKEKMDMEKALQKAIVETDNGKAESVDNENGQKILRKNELEWYKLENPSKGSVLKAGIYTRGIDPKTKTFYTGIVENYSDDGKILERFQLKNGFYDGVYRSYYEDGKICEEISFKNGEIDLKNFKTFSKEGKLMVSSKENGDGSWTVHTNSFPFLRYKDDQKKTLYDANITVIPIDKNTPKYRVVYDLTKLDDGSKDKFEFEGEIYYTPSISEDLEIDPKRNEAGQSILTVKGLGLVGRGILKGKDFIQTEGWVRFNELFIIKDMDFERNIYFKADGNVDRAIVHLGIDGAFIETWFNDNVKLIDAEDYKNAKKIINVVTDKDKNSAKAKVYVGSKNDDGEVVFVTEEITLKGDEFNKIKLARHENFFDKLAIKDVILDNKIVPIVELFKLINQREYGKKINTDNNLDNQNKIDQLNQNKKEEEINPTKISTKQKIENNKSEESQKIEVDKK